jgi:hypothetical protein
MFLSRMMKLVFHIPVRTRWSVPDLLKIIQASGFKVESGEVVRFKMPLSQNPRRRKALFPCHTGGMHSLFSSVVRFTRTNSQMDHDPPDKFGGVIFPGVLLPAAIRKGLIEQGWWYSGRKSATGSHGILNPVSYFA